MSFNKMRVNKFYQNGFYFPLTETAIFIAFISVMFFLVFPRIEPVNASLNRTSVNAARWEEFNGIAAEKAKELTAAYAKEGGACHYLDKEPILVCYWNQH